MGWQEDEVIRRGQIQQEEEDRQAKRSRLRAEAWEVLKSFWEKLVSENEKIIPAVRAPFFSNSHFEAVSIGPHGIYLRKSGAEIPFLSSQHRSSAGYDRVVNIRYSFERRQLVFSGEKEVPVEEKDIAVILKNICTGHDYWEGLV